MRADTVVSREVLSEPLLKRLTITTSFLWWIARLRKEVTSRAGSLSRLRTPINPRQRQQALKVAAHFETSMR